MIANHRKVQTWSLFEMRDFIRCFNELPGSIPVKLPLVVGLLYNLKREILWCFSHANQSKVFWKEFSHIIEVMYLMMKLDNLLE